MKSVIIALIATLAAAAPAIDAAGLESNVLIWTGDVQDGGANRTFTGTIEQIYGQVLKANPGYELANNPEVVKGIQKRTAYDCNIFSDIKANADGIISQINYLYGLRGNCGIQPGCTRVSCSYDNSVWGCSRTGGLLQVPCTELADRASGILGRCTKNGKVNGNAAEPNYFVDVHSSNC